MMLSGAAVGLYAGVRLLEAARQVSSFGWYLLALVWMMFAAVLAVYAQIALHEAGHLVCGLATGYKFCSFRVGSLQWQKQDGKLRMKRMNLAGTGGQCLLAPPEIVDGKMPYKLYNLGGPLANLLTAAVFELLAALCRWRWQLALRPAYMRAVLPMTWLGMVVWAATVLLDLLAITGLCFAALNGLPMRMGGVDNDGRNVLSLGQSPAAVCALWVQLKVNERLTNGVRLKDMPEEWFAVPDAAGLKKPLTAALAVLTENRLMDMQDFAAAARLADELESKETAILGVHRSMLLCDRLYCALLRGEDAAALLERWDGKNMKAFRKQMKSSTTVLRTEYAVALLHERDTAKAEAVRADFEKHAKSCPSSADAESEMELIEMAAEAAH